MEKPLRPAEEMRQGGITEEFFSEVWILGGENMVSFDTIEDAL